MQIVSWNVAGLRGFLKKYDLNKFLEHHDVDIICFNETKVRAPLKLNKIDDRYNSFWCHCCAPERARYGYSGVAVLVKKEINVISCEEEVGKDQEGRTLTLELDRFYLVATYVPNAGQGLVRLDYRVNEWDPVLRTHLCDLSIKKPVMWVGDLNVIRFRDDVNSVLMNRRFAGNTVEEKESFEKTLKDANLVEVRTEVNECPYTYWSFMGKSFQTNFGMRLDYCCATPEIANDIEFVTTLKDEVSGFGECCLGEKRSSDHAPLLIRLSGQEAKVTDDDEDEGDGGAD